MEPRQESWADMSALHSMPPVELDVRAAERRTATGSEIAIRLHNSSQHIAFFERAAIAAAPDGNEILPIEYDDNNITVYPGETAEIHGVFPQGAKAGWVKLDGHNTRAIAVPIKALFW